MPRIEVDGDISLKRSRSIKSCRSDNDDDDNNNNNLNNINFQKKNFTEYKTFLKIFYLQSGQIDTIIKLHIF